VGLQSCADVVEFNCLSYMSISDDFSLLWTNSNSKHAAEQLSCWVSKSRSRFYSAFVDVFLNFCTKTPICVLIFLIKTHFTDGIFSSAVELAR